jgi:glycosyltransferase involved in cell wall biosynthesis
MKPVLCIVTPCFNEEDVLKLTSKALTDVLNCLIESNKVSADSYVCFVDDGSTDNTWSVISEICSKNSTFKGVKLSNNFGHQNALLAGLFSQKNSSDCIITIDADLQDDVNVIHDMIDKYSAGNKIVYAVRGNRKSDSFGKRNSAQLFYKFMEWLGVKTIYNHADFRLADRQVIKSLEKYNEVNIFLRGIFPLMGFKHDIVYFERKARKYGETKYSLPKMLSFAWQGITSFNTSLLRLVTYIGIIMFCVSIITAIWVISAYFQNKTVAGWTSLLLVLSLSLGINMICLGVIGEYVGKIFLEVKQRPKFIIEEEL